MYTLDEMKERIKHLRTVSPAGARKPLNDLLDAIIAYLTRDAGFELQVHKTLDKVIADTFHHGLKYEHEELLDPWREIVPRGDAPLGYENVGELFKGSEVFIEIMSVTDRDFRAAYYRKETDTNTSSDGTGSTTEWYNKYVDKWIPKLQAAIAFELEGLKAIMQYCANRSYNIEWAILFEELGAYLERHPVRYYAKQIFLVKGYGWLIETFNLKLYRPSYMAELPYWEEEETNIADTKN